MDDLVMPAIVLALALVGLGFIWYANESRKQQDARKANALDFAMAGEPVGENTQIIKSRARDLLLFLEGEEVASRPIPIRVAEDDEEPSFGAMS